MSFRALVKSDASGRAGLARLAVRYFLSPTVSASVLLRAADGLLARGRRWPSRFVRAHLANKHGVHIAEGASVGSGFRLPHPVNVVVGPGAVLGDNVLLYQGVTVGAAAPRSEAWEFPNLGNDVTVYANAVIVGGIRIGDGAVVGAGALVTRSVPDGATVVGRDVVLAPRTVARSEERQTA